MAACLTNFEPIFTLMKRGDVSHFPALSLGLCPSSPLHYNCFWFPHHIRHLLIALQAMDPIHMEVEPPGPQDL